MSEELAATAARALERYRIEERSIEVEIGRLRVRLEAVREFIAVLTEAPRKPRKPRVVEPDPLAPPDGVLLTSDEAA